MAKLSRPPMIALIAVTFFVVSYSTTAVSGLGGKLGGKTKVKDVKTNQEVQDLGKYSVEKYNQQQQEKKKEHGGDLKFVEVVEAETQVVSGIKYYLKIAATTATNGERKTFDAEVLVKSWEGTKELLKFAPSPSDN